MLYFFSMTKTLYVHTETIFLSVKVLVNTKELIIGPAGSMIKRMT